MEEQRVRQEHMHRQDRGYQTSAFINERGNYQGECFTSARGGQRPKKNPPPPRNMPWMEEDR